MHVLICDDHALVRDALCGVVRRIDPDAEISQAGDFAGAVEASAVDADVCLLDLHMPGAEPFDGLARVIAASPATPVLVVTGLDTDEALKQALALGAAGYAPKTTDPAMLEAAIRLVLAGGIFLPNRAAQGLGGTPNMPAAAQAPTAPPPRPEPTRARPSGDVRLTDRQLDVLRLVIEGRTTKEIARSLGLSPATVKTHTRAVLAALQAANRTEAVSRARDAGLI